MESKNRDFVRSLTSERSLNLFIGATGVLSIPASLSFASHHLIQLGLEPVAVATTVSTIALGALYHRWAMSRESVRREELDGLEHDFIHNLRNHAAEVGVLAYNDRLTRDQFDSKLDHALQGACEKLVEILRLRYNKDCSVSIHLINADQKFPFVSRDHASFKDRAKMRRRDETLSTGMEDILGSDPRDAPIKSYWNISKEHPNYADTELEQPEKAYHSTVTVGIQARIADIVRNRHRSVFTQRLRTIAGFLTVEIKDAATFGSLHKEALSKYADALFLELQVFASAELTQFGPDNATIGDVATELLAHNASPQSRPGYLQ